MEITRKNLDVILDFNLICKLQGFYLDQKVCSPDSREQLLDEVYEATKAASYHPKKPAFEITINKGGGILRYLEMFEPVDYLLYFFCLILIDRDITNHIPVGCYGSYPIGAPGRVLKKYAKKLEHQYALGAMPEPSSLHLASLARYNYLYEYHKYSERLLKYAYANPTYNVLVLDIANFYDCIRLDILERKLYYAIPEARWPIIELLLKFLRHWQHSTNPHFLTSVGLPQDLVGDCSRLLANFYLYDFDRNMLRFCDQHKAKYVRYSDDQIFFLPKTVHPELFTQKVSSELRRIGLNLNAYKYNFFDSINNFLKFRGYDIYETLKGSPAHTMAEVSPAYANRFAKAFLNRDKSTLHKDGSSIMKTIISIGLEKYDPALRSELLRLVNYDYIDRLGECHFDKLQSSLSETELQTFIYNLDITLSHHLHNSTKYEAYQSFRYTKINIFEKYLPHILNAHSYQ